MALLDLWNSDRDQITGKRIDQLISFTGEGRLLDGNDTSGEFRGLLKSVPSEIIGRWIDECLSTRFQDFGFVLQDVVNEIGRRLSFDITHGVYRGHANGGYDGVWRVPGGRAILIEAKSSTAYSINLSRISEYRKQIAPQIDIRPEAIAILIVVGGEDTSEFEAQVRGSRFAWDIRLLGVASLYRLLRLKETLDDPKVERQIQDILFPQEFTRLDGIIDLVFATAEDAQDTAAIESDDIVETEAEDVAVPRQSPANFHSAILPRLESYFGQALVRKSRVQWITADETNLLSCQVSKRYTNRNMDFWFGLKRTTKESLEKHCSSFCAFGLGSAQRVILMPFTELVPHLDSLYTSPDSTEGVLHWHVRFVDTETGVALFVDRDQRQYDVTQFLLTT